ncbi:hypothetical protein AALO_G00224190 [Alosa alosa]|uniref:Uncharacterized protein n=1 Tax=Alosa alosa TaxID=278164 RepID=A0AAV6G128_9TELE|nr:hypothetical protein AALO_G00224190 [Alosa alosa]
MDGIHDNKVDKLYTVYLSYTDLNKLYLEKYKKYMYTYMFRFGWMGGCLFDIFFLLILACSIVFPNVGSIWTKKFNQGKGGNLNRRSNLHRIYMCCPNQFTD